MGVALKSRSRSEISAAYTDGQRDVLDDKIDVDAGTNNVPTIIYAELN
jgi:hypothetical protein